MFGISLMYFKWVQFFALFMNKTNNFKASPSKFQQTTSKKKNQFEIVKSKQSNELKFSFLFLAINPSNNTLKSQSQHNVKQVQLVKALYYQ